MNNNLLTHIADKGFKVYHSPVLETYNSIKTYDFFLNFRSKKFIDTLAVKTGLEASTSFIVLITFCKSNTRVTFLDSTGSVLVSYSSGLVGLKGKKKINRQVAVQKLIFLLNKSVPSSSEIGPISLHLKNTGSVKKVIVKIVQSCFLISSIKAFDMYPYNGCRKKKLRRKKMVSKIKR